MLDSKMITLMEVARQANYTRAAEALHMTQPAVTQHIHKLEEYFHCKLTDTSGRAVRLTAAGENVLQYARLQRANERRLMERIAAGEPPLRVGATLSIADYYLPQELSRYLSRGGAAPHVEVGNTRLLLKRMLDGSLDCAFIEGLFDEKLFSAKVWRQADYVAMARAGHPLARGKHTLSELFDWPLLLREVGSGTRAVLESALFVRGMSPESFCGCYEFGSFGLIKAALGATDAVSFMYERVCEREMHDGTLKRLDVKDFSLTRPLYFLCPEGSGEGARCERFLSELMEG